MEWSTRAPKRCIWERRGSVAEPGMNEMKKWSSGSGSCDAILVGSTYPAWSRGGEPRAKSQLNTITTRSDHCNAYYLLL